MQMVPAPALEIPDGWILEVRPRLNTTSCLADKYYYEPHTGRQFRSLLSIKRYLDGEEESPAPQRNAILTDRQGALKLGVCRRVVYGGKLWGLEAGSVPGRIENPEPASVPHRAASLLPDGWIVEEVPRSCGFKIDTYYIEPKTRRKFRSVPEVARYLISDDYEEEDEDADSFKPIKMIHPNPTMISQLPCPPQGSCRRKETCELIADDMINLPDQIRWTLVSTGTSSESDCEDWIPFLEEYRVPDYVKRAWQDAFFLGMTGSRNKHQYS